MVPSPVSLMKVSNDRCMQSLRLHPMSPTLNDELAASDGRSRTQMVPSPVGLMKVSNDSRTVSTTLHPLSPTPTDDPAASNG